MTPDKIRQLEGSGPWLHAPAPRARPGRIRAWLTLLAFAAGLVIGAHVAGKAMQQAALDAVQWEMK